MIPKYLHKYPIASCKADFRRSKTAIGYKTKSAVYIYCPFHKEKSPSMRITVSHGAKCFGCGESLTNIRMGQILKERIYKRPTFIQRWMNEDPDGQLFFVFDIDMPF